MTDNQELRKENENLRKQIADLATLTITKTNNEFSSINNSINNISDKMKLFGQKIKEFKLIKNKTFSGNDVSLFSNGNVIIKFSDITSAQKYYDEIK